MKPTKPITDPAFRYHGSATHSDAKVFERRMKARRRLAERKARQQASATVEPITKRRTA